MRASVASRLSALYAALLGIIVLLVIVASSVALVYELSSFTGDIVFAKHEEARLLTEQYRVDGLSLKQAAPQIVSALSGIGLRVTVYDKGGHFLAGDKTLRPAMLDRVVSGKVELLPPPGPSVRPSAAIQMKPAVPFSAGQPPQTIGDLVFHETRPRVFQESVQSRGGAMRPEPFSLTAVNGGYVAFEPSLPLVLVALIPYWKVVLTIAAFAILLSWLIGRFFARQALAPINEVTLSLKALAEGDYTQRQFVMHGGDEVATLTAAYNEAVAGVASAMGERRRTEERMRQFVADASHELRTPLTVIGGYVDVLRRGAIEEPTIARQILGTMSLEKEHMRKLIDRLMRMARMDSDEPPEKSPIDVADLLRSQCDAARRLDDQRTIDYSVDGVAEIQGDRTELGEALWNVVENAVKFAPDAPIHLSASRQNGAVLITVRDEGPGMTESERLHAFERFYRGDQRGEIAGSGLGLAIARRAVERAGGRIDLESAPGKGTTVSIRL